MSRVTQTRYEQAGVRGQDAALAAVRRHLGPTLEGGPARVLTDFGHYAAVLQVNEDLALAVCTDSVGSKTVIAAALDRYETIGFDLVAMNANDLVCVGARPLALVDYVGVNALDQQRMEAILAGLGAAAAEARIAIPGGEVAQLPDVIGSDGRGPGDPAAFDLVGTCVGTLHPSDLVTGDAIAPGDVIVGIASSGIHSNGLTLARRALLTHAGFRLERHVDELGRTVGEELLEPTLIYVRPVLELWARRVATHGLAHITGDGLANLARLGSGVGYRIEELFTPPPIFGLIQRAGEVGTEEMFRVFNMGVGFAVIVAAEDVEEAVAAIAATGHEARPIGAVTDEAGVVRIEPAGIVWREQ